MKKNKIYIAAGTLVMALLLVACKPSEEKLNEAESARTALIEAKNKAENTYLDITDSSLRESLDKLAAEETEIEKTDFTKMSDRMIDRQLPKITEITEEYKTIQKSLDGILQEETLKREEAANNAAISAYIINGTEYTISELILHDITADTMSDNLLGEGVTLAPGYTLMGVDLNIKKNSTQWEMIIKDDGGKAYSLACGDFNQASKDGISITLNYDSGAGTGAADLENH